MNPRVDLLTAPAQISISSADLDQMRQDVESRRPEEACGLLAGWVSREAATVECVIPMRNVLQSANRYRLDPAEQLEAFAWIEAQGLELVGIYHSHPEGPATPSETDISEAGYPQAVYWIWSKQTGEWRYASFVIQKETVLPVTILFNLNEREE